MSNDKPDDRERAIRHYAASIVGEYVAGQVRRDFIAGADWGHARALEEMGAEIERLMSTREWNVKLREQLAAAEFRAQEYEKALERITGYGYAGTSFADGRVLIAKEVLAKHRRGGE